MQTNQLCYHLSRLEFKLEKNDKLGFRQENKKLFSFRNKNIPASVSGDRFGFPVFRFGFDVVLKIVQIVFLVEELRAVPGYRDFFGAFEVHFKLSSC